MDIPMYFEPMGILQSNQHPGKWFWDITDALYKVLMGHDLIRNPQVAPTPAAIAPAVTMPPPSQQPRVDPVHHTPQQWPESNHSTLWWSDSLHITEIHSNAMNDTHHASDVTQPQMNSTQCTDRDQVLTESSFMNFQFDQNLIGDLPSFDGERDKFCMWKHRIQNITDIMGEDKALKILRLWLGVKPSDFLHMRPLMYTLQEVLDCLMAEYDPVGDEMKAANKYCSIKQNTKSISDHHSEVYMLLQNMGKDINTYKSMTINTYIWSLTNQGLREAIFCKWNESNMSLQQVMQYAHQGEKAKNLATGPTDSTPVAPVTITVANKPEPMDTGDKLAELIGATVNKQFMKFKKTNFQNNSPSVTKFCKIHKVWMYSTEQCQLKDKEECIYCEEKMKKGEMVDHINKCKALRCHSCNWLGHKSWECHLRFMKWSSSESKDGPQAKKMVNAMTTESETTKEEAKSEWLCVTTLLDKQPGSLFVPKIGNGMNIEALWDTGAWICWLTVAWFHLWFRTELNTNNLNAQLCAKM